MTVEPTTTGSPSVLLVEPRIADARLLRRLLIGSSAVLTHVETWRDAQTAASLGHYDLVLAASSLPEGPRGKSVYEVAGTAPVVVLVEPGEHALGKSAVASGATGWVTKNFKDGNGLRDDINKHINALPKPASTVSGLHNPHTEPTGAVPSVYQRMVEQTSSGLVVLDSKNIIQFANPSACDMLSDGEPGLVGTEFTHPAPIGPPIEVILSNSNASCEMRVASFDWQGQPARLVTLRDDSVRADSQVALRALADRLGANNVRLERLASCDSLTELPNRRGLEAAVSSSIGQVSRTGDPTLAALIDCDDFKQINTDLGHAGGDIVLKVIADRLRESLRPADHVGRLGGDEFLAILPDTSMSVGMAVAQRLRVAVNSRPIEVGNHQVNITVSVGVVPFPSTSRSLQDVVSATRVALLHSKAGGKDRVATDSGTKAISRAINGVVRAIAKGEGLRTLAQPLYGLQTRKIVGYELLSRGPMGDFETPDAFFRLALQERILHQADLRCLDACIAASASVPAGRRVHLNMFPTTVSQMDPHDLLKRLKPVLDVRPVCIEISQQHVVGDPRPLRERLGVLRDAGVLLALDNVGSGRTSLETLIHFAPDLVKIDRHLISGVGSARGKSRTLERLLGVLQNLKTEVAAVGIESVEDLTALRDLGVPIGQGFAMKEAVLGAN